MALLAVGGILYMGVVVFHLWQRLRFHTACGMGPGSRHPPATLRQSSIASRSVAAYER
jgi:hypothetical protein